MINPPCKDCAARAIGCHSGCEKFKEFQAKQAERREATTAAYKKIQMLKDVEKPHRRVYDARLRARNDLLNHRTK